MMSLKVERYATFNPLTRALFKDFSNHSLLMRLDSIESNVRRNRPREYFVAESVHHLKAVIDYLASAKRHWRSNILGGSLDDIHQICIAATHYAHSRLIPSFIALSLAGNQCLQELQDYLRIEAEYLTILQFILDSWNTPENSVVRDCVFELYVSQYEAAMSSFCDALGERLKLSLNSSGDGN
jgi:hypothetical protein